MAKSLKLYLDHLSTPQIVWFRRPDGTLDSLPALRLVAYANFLRALKPGKGSFPYLTTKCVVDTGAHFSIIAEDLWRRFRPGFVSYPGLPTDCIFGGHLFLALAPLRERVPREEAEGRRHEAGEGWISCS